MLTKLTIRNFKRFDEVEIDLGNPVVFIGFDQYYQAEQTGWVLYLEGTRASKQATTS